MIIFEESSATFEPQLEENGDSFNTEFGTVYVLGNGTVDGDFTIDRTLKFVDGVLSVNTTSRVEADNTLPITSAGVHVVVGNIEALLGGI